MSKKPGKRRWSLTLLYSTAFFLIQLAAVLITAALSFLLTKLGVLDNLGIPRSSGFTNNSKGAVNIWKQIQGRKCG